MTGWRAVVGGERSEVLWSLSGSTGTLDPTEKSDPMDSLVWSRQIWIYHPRSDVWNVNRHDHRLLAMCLSESTRCSALFSGASRDEPFFSPSSESEKEDGGGSGAEEGRWQSALIMGVMESAQSRLVSSFHPQRWIIMFCFYCGVEPRLPARKCGWE